MGNFAHRTIVIGRGSNDGGTVANISTTAAYVRKTTSSANGPDDGVAEQAALNEQERRALEHLKTPHTLDSLHRALAGSHPNQGAMDASELKQIMERFLEDDAIELSEDT